MQGRGGRPRLSRNPAACPEKSWPVGSWCSPLRRLQVRARGRLSLPFFLSLSIHLSLSFSLSTFFPLAPSQTSGRRTVGPTAVSTNRTRARRRSSAPHSHFFPAATDLLFSDANFRRFGPEKTATVVADVTNDETTERRQKRSVLIFFVKKIRFR